MRSRWRAAGCLGASWGALLGGGAAHGVTEQVSAPIHAPIHAPTHASTHAPTQEQPTQAHTQAVRPASAVLVPTDPGAAGWQALSLFVGQAKVIDRARSNIVRVAVGHGGLLKATVIDERQIVLLGEGAGETTVHLWMKDGSESSFNVLIHPEHTARIRTELRTLLHDLPELQPRVVGNKILLEGRYRDAVAARRVKRLLATYPEVLNLVADEFDDVPAIRVDPMIHLDLRVVEVRKRALDQLGIKWASTADGPTAAVAAVGYANAIWPARAAGFPPVNTGRPVLGYLGLATQITSALQFLEQSGDSWTLAEPRLSCKSGGKSKFVAGGEIPIPVSAGTGQTHVVYKQYGVVIEFNPVSDAQGNIESKIDVEVSEPDPRNSNQGFVAFTTNRTTTQVAMKHNTPLVISGLLRQQGFKSLDGVPGLSGMPVLGGLFRSREFRQEESELLVIVTPRLISSEALLNTDAVQQGQAHVDALRGQFKPRLAE
jgi:pilus assembly protein CpaC